jgi:hypothetical protein
MSTTQASNQIYVGGEWGGAASGDTMEVLNPATGEVIAEVPRCGADDVDRAVEAARAALRSGSTRRRRNGASSCSSSLPCSRSTRTSLPESSR